jgi:2-polyprenyl-3-methyl-5-hydroxy-6-metoxy-1,4-benzoquinol methylase
MLDEELNSAWDKRHQEIATHSAEVQRIIEMAGLQGPSKVLDLACGTGKHLIEFAGLGHTCRGNDVLDWKVQKAVAHSSMLGLDIKFSCGDLRTLEAEEKYDLVVCLYAMSCLAKDDDFLAALKTARKAMQSEGKFVFNVLNAEAYEQSKPPGFEEAVRTGYLRFFSLDEIEVLATRAGLKIEETRCFDLQGTTDLDMFILAA